MEFIAQHEVLNNKIVTHLNPVCDMRPHKKEINFVKLVIGGDLIFYKFQAYTPTSEIVTIKTHWNNILHHRDAGHTCFEFKYFYICSTLPSPKYACIQNTDQLYASAQHTNSLSSDGNLCFHS